MLGGTQSRACSSRQAVRVAAAALPARARARPAATRATNAAPEGDAKRLEATRGRRARRCRVFLGWMPLFGTERVVNALPAPLRRLLMLHSYVLVEEQERQGDVLPLAPSPSPSPSPSSSPSPPPPSFPPPPPQRRLLLLDFLPVRPTHPATAAALLTGGSVPGLARARELPRGARLDAVSPGVRLVWEQEDGGGGGGRGGGGGGAWARARAAGAAVAAAPLRLAGNDCRTHSAAVLTAVLGRTVSRGELEGWMR